MLRIGVGGDALRIAAVFVDAERGPAAAESAKLTGLQNVVQRLLFLYPDDPDVVAIRSSPGAGTTVLIRLDPEKTPC